METLTEKQPTTMTSKQVLEYFFEVNLQEFDRREEFRRRVNHTIKKKKEQLRKLLTKRKDIIETTKLQEHDERIRLMEREIHNWETCGFGNQIGEGLAIQKELWKSLGWEEPVLEKLGKERE